jgi:hypothetical protein
MSMNRNQQIWSVLDNLPEGPIKDSVFVCATALVFNLCPSLKALERVGVHLRNEKGVSECDLAVLRKVYRNRMSEIRAKDGT